MANTAVKQFATPYALCYLLTGDGTVTGPTIPSATLLADMVDGPLKDAWSVTTYTGEAGRRVALVGGNPCVINVRSLSNPVQTTAEQNLISVGVDADAVTANLTEVNVVMSDTTGQVAMMTLEYRQPPN